MIIYVSGVSSTWISSENTGSVKVSGYACHLILSEQGFTSDSPERGGQVLELQAQSIAEAYQAAKANPYVEGFFLNRMHDEPSLLGAHYAFGLIGTDGTKKPAWQTYKDLQ